MSISLSNLSQLMEQPITYHVNQMSDKIETPWMVKLFGFTDQGTEGNILIKTLVGPIPADCGTIGTTLFYNASSGQLTVRNTTNSSSLDLTYQAGWFVTPTVKEIREMVKSIVPVSDNPQTNFGIVQGKDVGRAHNEAHGPQVFQAASQMNALEMINPNILPEDGIEGYIFDHTQGPCVALVCAPGTLLRNYYFNVLPGEQFNALSELGLIHKNGYLLWGNYPESVLDKLNGMEDLIRIPTMVHTQVAGITVNYGVNRHIINKTVHQIYSSAVPIDTYGNSGDWEIQQTVARKIILSEYIGAIGMALLLHHFDVKHGKSGLERAVINLTLIGTEKFNVPEELAIKAILEAKDIYKGYSFDLFIHGYKESTVKNIQKITSYPVVSFGHKFGYKISRFPDTISENLINRPVQHLTNEVAHRVLHFNSRLPDVTPNGNHLSTKSDTVDNLLPRIQQLEILDKTRVCQPRCISKGEYTVEIYNGPSSNGGSIKPIDQFDDVKNYLLIVVRKTFLEVYTLRSYQEVILKTIWSAPDGAKQFRYVDPHNCVDVTTFDCGFIAKDGDKRYFVRRNDPAIGQIVTSVNQPHAYQLMDHQQQIMTSWPPS